ATATSGDPVSGSTTQAPGSIGPGQSLNQGQTSTATSGPSSAQPATPSGTSTAGPTTQGSGTATASAPTAVATSTSEPQANVASVQATDAGPRESGIPHSQSTIRTTGGTSASGTLTIHWQHRLRPFNAVHRTASPQQH